VCSRQIEADRSRWMTIEGVSRREGHDHQSPNLRNRSFKPLLKRAGLRPIRFHDLHHTCATLPLSKDVNPKIASEMLGHSSTSVTLGIYSHLLPDMQEKATKALEEALS
jgi:integrase